MLRLATMPKRRWEIFGLEGDEWGVWNKNILLLQRGLSGRFESGVGQCPCVQLYVLSVDMDV